MNKITLIFGYRDREPSRVRFALESLSAQTNKNFEVLFVDYGSNDEFREPIAGLVNNFSFCTYVYNDTTGMPWNRSHALNTGIKLAQTDFVFTADVDMIFKSNFIETLNKLADEQKAIFFSVYYMPSQFNDWKNIEKYKFDKSKNFALGLALIPRKTLIAINGYDEFFSVWGHEDNDMEQRLKQFGAVTEFYDKEVMLYHQWHLPAHSDDSVFPERIRVFFKDYQEAVKEKIVRNEKSEWGKIIKPEQRQAKTLFSNGIFRDKIISFNNHFFSLWLQQRIDSMGAGQNIHFTWHEVQNPNPPSSKISFFIKWLKWTCKKLKLPVVIISEYSSNFSSVYNVRDELFYFIYRNQSRIKDYYYHISENKLMVIIAT